MSLLLIWLENYTYSIDLSSSWTNSTVVLNKIEKGSAPIVNNEALWLDASNSTFYAYDGGLSRSLPAQELPPSPLNSLWQFTPSGKSGRWSSFPVAPGSLFSTLVRTTTSICTSGNGLGFALGGIVNDNTDESLSATGVWTQYNVPGMVMYNTDSQKWYNASTRGYSYDGSAYGGAAQFVPTFGPAGLVFVFAGMTANNQYVPFTDAYMYDPSSQQWQTQQVSGEIPPEIASPCVVGIQGENTYEVC